MSNFFVYTLLILLFFLGWWSFSNLHISEDLDTAIPNAAAFKKIKPLLDKGKKSVVFSLALNPSTDNAYITEKKAIELVTALKLKAGSHINNLQYKSDLDPSVVSNYFFNHLYLFLDSSDYNRIKLSLASSNIRKTMVENKQSLYSPEGLALKEWTIKDPLHFMQYGYSKIKSNALSNNYLQNEGLFISEDQRTLFIYGELAFNPSESDQNSLLAKTLSDFRNNWNSLNEQYQVDFFGTFLIADANAKQIEKDIKFTLTIAIICIIALLLYYFRNLFTLALFLLPGAFGVLFAIAGVYAWQGSISGIALSAGAVILGIVIDYSFHFFAQFKQSNNAIETRKTIFIPLLLSGSTTIIAFLSLTFANSRVLHDFGLFTALSLTGALIFVLFILPQLLKPLEKKLSITKSNKLDTLVDKINLEPSKHSKLVASSILIITIVFFFFASKIEFESDLNKINYYPKQLKEAEIKHQNINPDTEKRVHFLVEGNSDNEIANKNQQLYSELIALNDSIEIKQITSLGLFVLSKDEQVKKINQWNTFWKLNGETTWNQVEQTADSLGFKKDAFAPFNTWISKTLKPEDSFKFIKESNTLSQLVLHSNEVSENEEKLLITSIVIKKSDYHLFRKQFGNNPNYILVDGTSVMSMLTEAVKDDFNYLLIFASVLVFVAMLLIYGSFELTLITFIPIAISWIWILGISALFGFKFNFINIIIITFIFGLGDDFAIFITDGLQSKYKYGREVLSHYKSGIILSSLSTIIGTGVLFFAKHPAIKSIAAISVTGILTIVFISFFVQPLLFHFFTTRRTNHGKPPVTIRVILMSIIGYSIFILGSLLGVFLGFLIRITPFKTKSWKKDTLHKMLKWITGTMLDILFNTKKRYYNLDRLDFTQPSVIIANHTSFFDILALARLHPNVIMLVNKWVYDSVLFGNAIKYADYIPTFDSLDNNLEKLKKLINHGYSIIVFPEGTRSADGKMGRFHKGAFYLADTLNLDITPIVLHGFSYIMPKHDYNLKDGFLSTYVLPRIKYDDKNFGTGYKERTKLISTYFKKSYTEVAELCEEIDYQYYPLLYSYKYKGPVLEWYFRVKWKFEKRNYETYYKLIGAGNKRVYDLGCGYGFLSYYLKLRNSAYSILAYDYDNDKIDIAQHSYLKTKGIEFETCNITNIVPKDADAIILADTLHYLNKEKQLKVLNKCVNGLNTGGLLLIRDGLADLKNAHNWTKKSEKWSTKYLKFNKTQGNLYFFTKQFIENWAKENNFSLVFDSQSANSSNTLMVLTKLS